jgi:hypothetical protein
VHSLTLLEVRVELIRRFFGENNDDLPAVDITGGADALPQLQVVRMDSISDSHRILEENGWLNGLLEEANDEQADLVIIKAEATLLGDRRSIRAGDIGAVLFDHYIRVLLPVTGNVLHRTKLREYDQLLAPPSHLEAESAALKAAAQAAYQLTK